MTESKEFNGSHCSECGSTYLSHDGEITCRNCGLVLSKVYDCLEAGGKHAGHHNIVITYRSPEPRTPTYSRILRRHDQDTRATKIRILDLLNYLKSKYFLTGQQLDQVDWLIQKQMKKEALKSKRQTLLTVFASVFIVLRRSEKPISSKEFHQQEKFYLNHYSYTTFRNKLHEMQILLTEKRRSPKEYTIALQVLENMNINEPDIIKACLDLITKVKQTCCNGKRSQVIVSGILYHVLNSQLEKEFYQKEIAKILGISTVSVSNSLKMLKKEGIIPKK